jgi:hypothetical protein
VNGLGRRPCVSWAANSAATTRARVPRPIRSYVYAPVPFQASQ